MDASALLALNSQLSRLICSSRLDDPAPTLTLWIEMLSIQPVRLIANKLTMH